MEMKRKLRNLEFRDEDMIGVFRSHGFKCFIRLNKAIGVLCGYVVLPKEHFLYGESAERINDLVDVHGGITFCEEFREGYVVGFDTGHAGDALPRLRFIGGKRWSEEEVVEETRRLAKQLVPKNILRERL